MRPNDWIDTEVPEDAGTTPSRYNENEILSQEETIRLARERYAAELAEQQREFDEQRNPPKIEWSKAKDPRVRMKEDADLMYEAFRDRTMAAMDKKSFYSATCVCKRKVRIPYPDLSVALRAAQWWQEHAFGKAPDAPKDQGFVDVGQPFDEMTNEELEKIAKGADG